MLKRLPALLAVLSVWVLSLSPALAVEVPGEIDEVTVYRGQALVTRVIDLREVPAGHAGGDNLRELIVTDLPAAVVPGSVFAEADAADVRSVRFRSRPVQEDIREEVRELNAELERVADDVKIVERKQKLVREQLAYLDKLESFTAVTATRELSEGVLDAEELKGMTVFTFEQRERLANRELELASQAEELREQRELLQRERAELASGSSKTVREAVVFLEMPEGGPAGVLRVQYLVNHASWDPSYNLRAADLASGQPVRLEYYGEVQQRSGEDWSDVRMTLSTATPSLIASAPTLEPLAIALGEPDPELIELRRQAEQAQLGYTQLRKQIQLEQAVTNQRNHAGLATGVRRPGRLAAPMGMAQDAIELRSVIGGERADRFADDFSDEDGWDGGVALNGVALNDNRVVMDALAFNEDELNGFSRRLQVLDLFIEDEDLDSARRRELQDPRASASPVVSYVLAKRTSLPSRKDRQLIQIAEAELPAEFFKSARPLLGEFVYNEAEVINRTRTVLLAGPITAYVDDQFVGRGKLPTVAGGERFSVGFGVDPTLRAERQLIDKASRIMGGNRLTEYTYEIAVQNFGGQAAAVRLIDRLPLAEGEGVRVELAEATPSPTNAEALDDRGMLRWDLDVPAGDDTGQAGRASVRYAFTIEHDRQRTLTALP
jgi:hypothetical protein